MFINQYLIIFVFMTLGFSTNSTPIEVTYEDEVIQKNYEQITAFIGIEQSNPSTDDNGRSYNLKYVTAIQSSGIWEEVKKRSLTITSGVDQKLISREPETLSDEELMQLKQACHDGLKCVAVDQLLVLKKIELLTDDGKKAVRMAIIKITKVITKYTTEYHEDIYQYTEVTESDDLSKVYQSITKIVEDNKELCKVDISANSDNAYSSKNDDGTTVSENNKASSNSTNSTDPKYSTINHYNINYGTVNTAFVNIPPTDENNTDINFSKSKTQDQSTSTNENPQDTAMTNSSDSVADNKTNENGDQVYSTNDNSQSTSFKNSPDRVADSNNFANSEPTHSTNENPQVYIMRLLPEGTTSNNTFENNDQVQGTQKDDSEQSNNVDKSSVSVGNVQPSNTDRPMSLNTSKCIPNSDTDNSANNNVEKDVRDITVDVSSTGTNNKNSSKKGYVEDGALNNGQMKVYNINKGVINKGMINRSSADGGGIINVGTVNNGPTNNGTVESYTNRGTDIMLSNYDVQQFVTSIDKMYSTILEGLVK